MPAGSITRSSTALTRRGNSLRHSAPDAAALSTATESDLSGGYSKETVIALSAMVAGLLAQTLNGDSVWLAMRDAELMASQAGVSKEEFERVRSRLTKYWEKRKASNPLSCLF